MDCHIVFLITTYNRPRSLHTLVMEIAKYGDVYILDDGSTETVNLVDCLQGHKIFYAVQQHQGKHFYWKTVNALWLMVHQKKYDYYFMIPDDFLPVDKFVEKAIQTWLKIPDKRKICMNTYVSLGRLNKKNWTNVKPKEHKHYRYTQWVDMCFMCERAFFDAIGFIPRIHLDWRHHPERSSGVGSHISRELHKKGYSIYQTMTSMFIPQEEAYNSMMNAWRDKSDPLNIPVL